MADITDRLGRLHKREELARRVRQRPGATGLRLDSLGQGFAEEFVEVLEAVARVVLRYPGLSVMVAPADGRSGRSVVRLSEQDGSVEAVIVSPPGSGAGGPEHVERPGSARHYLEPPAQRTGLAEPRRASIADAFRSEERVRRAESELAGTSTSSGIERSPGAGPELDRDSADAAEPTQPNLSSADLSSPELSSTGLPGAELRDGEHPTDDDLTEPDLRTHPALPGPARAEHTEVVTDLADLLGNRASLGASWRRER